jgi:hypothetical protein
MQFFVLTNKKALTITIDLQTNGNDILIVGGDSLKENTEYFNRLCIDDDKYTFNLPKSPNILKVIIFESTEGFTETSDKYKINGVVINNLLNKPLFIDEDTKEFIDFAQEFALKCGYLKPGNYFSKNNKFQIQYLSTIGDRDSTPSRIHKSTGVIDCSKKWFDGMTIPGRVAILVHEYAHNHMQNESLTNNDDIEREADENGLQLYNGMGYPKIEWVYAWDHIFTDNDKHIGRLVNSIDKLQQIE